MRYSHVKVIRLLIKDSFITQKKGCSTFHFQGLGIDTKTKNILQRFDDFLGVHPAINSCRNAQCLYLNNKCQKCAGMGLNGFILKKIPKLAI